MRLVQGGGVEHGFDAAQAPADDRAVGDRADLGGEGGVRDVEADHLVSGIAQRTDQGLAQVARAARHQSPHRPSPGPCVSRAAIVPRSSTTRTATRLPAGPRMVLPSLGATL